MFLFVLTSTVCLLYHYFTRTFNYWKNKNVIGPVPIPFFGNFKNVALRKQHMGMLYNEIYKLYPGEKVVGLYRMTSPALLIRDLDIVKQILIKDFDAFSERGTYFSDKGLGQNIFHANTETWQILRNRLSSVFTTSKFKSVFHLLANRADNLANYIENVTKEMPEQDVYQIILRHVVGITMVAVFGLDIDTVNNENRLFEIFDENLKTSRLNEWDMLFPGWLTKFNLSIVCESGIKFAHEIVKTGSCYQLPNKSTLYNVMDVLLNMKKNGDILKQDKFGTEQSYLKITDDLLAAQAWILYVASYGNNTLALTYALYHLAHNQDVQEKLRQEIHAVMNKHAGKLTFEALTEMKYLEMVFEETIRMHPLTNALARIVSKNVTLEGTDLVIHKGTTVLISPYAIQHDAKYYPEPERFNPDRFLPENVRDRHPCAFLSFGTGRRGCLGSRLARIQFGVCMTKIISKFRVEPSSNTISSIKYDPCRLLLTPEERIVLKFINRNSSF